MNSDTRIEISADTSRAEAALLECRRAVEERRAAQDFPAEEHTVRDLDQYPELIFVWCCIDPEKQDY